jgi:hypothetical protein
MEQLGENPAEFAEIEDGLRTSFLPSNEIQKMLVHEIASLEWQRQRLERAQAALFHALAEAGPKAPPDESIVSGLHLELLGEISDVTSQYDFYLREHADLTPTMRDECLAPNSKQRALLIYLGMIDRQIDQKICLLLTLQEFAADREGVTRAHQQDKGDKTRSEEGEEGSPKILHSYNYLILRDEPNFARPKQASALHHSQGVC